MSEWVSEREKTLINKPEAIQFHNQPHEKRTSVSYCHRFIDLIVSLLLLYVLFAICCICAVAMYEWMFIHSFALSLCRSCQCVFCSVWMCVCVRSKKNNFTIKHVLQSTNKREKFARVHLKVIKTDRQPASQPLSHAWIVIGSGAAYNYYNH